MLAKWQSDIVEDCHRIEQGTVLKQHAESLSHFGESRFVELLKGVTCNGDVAAVGPLQTTNHSQQRALPCPTRPHQDGDATRQHFAGQVPKDIARSVAQKDGVEGNVRLDRFCHIG